MKKLLGILVLMCALVLGVACPVIAAGDVCSELDCTGADKDLCAVSGCAGDDMTADKFANNLISVALSLVGLIAIGVMIFGGIMYTISTGDAAKVQRAKHIIMYGLIGFGVTLLAYAIVRFITEVISA